MMTYLYAPEKVKARLDRIRATGDGAFLPGDGFDKADAPALDAYLESLGYRVTWCTTQGAGQFKEVQTACGLVVARNGYAHKVGGPRIRLATPWGFAGQTV